MLGSHGHWTVGGFTVRPSLGRRSSIKCWSLRTRETHTCCRALGSGAVITCFNDLCLSWPWIEPRPHACWANGSCKSIHHSGYRNVNIKAPKCFKWPYLPNQRTTSIFDQKTDDNNFYLWSVTKVDLLPWQGKGIWMITIVWKCSNIVESSIFSFEVICYNSVQKSTQTRCSRNIKNCRINF